MADLTRREFLELGLSAVAAGGLAGWGLERALAEPLERLVANVPEVTLGPTGWKTKPIGMGCIFRGMGKWPVKESDRLLDMLIANGINVFENGMTYGKGDTGTWIEDTGFVVRLLSDDNDGSRHQRIVLQLRGGQTLLIAHNIDLANRVPLGLGDRVRFRGMYEWNDLGGLVHWTHHDPLMKRAGGWIEHKGKRYQ